jgi:DNA modification methylase
MDKVLNNLPEPYYSTDYGVAYLGDALELIKKLPDASINLIMTSPPFALTTKKAYGNADSGKYIEWFRPFAREFWRVLRDDGSLVIHIGGSWDKGRPTRSLYQFELLLDLCRNSKEWGFYFAQDFYWFNYAKLPLPAEWVTVQRIRAKDAVDPIWWLSKSPFPKADNRRILNPYSEKTNKLLKQGHRGPSGHNSSLKFKRELAGAIPPNLLYLANSESGSQYLCSCRQLGICPHPARYPVDLPKFFIEFLTEPGDIILDPFGGSNATGDAAERTKRRWVCFEIREEYLKGSKYRFQLSQESKDS